MESPAQSHLSDLRPLLEGLSRMHRWVAISEAQGRVLWTSDDSLENTVLADQETRPLLLEVMLKATHSHTSEPLQLALAQIQSQLERGSEHAEIRCRFGGQKSDDERLELRAFCSRLPSGQPVLISVVDPVDDASPGDRAQLQLLERRNEELESYLHGVCHDLRSPLVTLLGFIRLLRDDYSERVGPEGRHFIDRIERAGIDLNSRIDELLTLSRITVNDDRRSLVDPRNVLVQVQTDLKNQLEEQGSSLILPADLPPVLCDSNHLYQIFSHLITSALQHMGECDDRRIEIQIHDDGPKHRIHVRDHGEGIPPADLEQIFEVFHSGTGSMPRRNSSGIGLAIVRKIAQAHGGEAWAESEGRGTHFYVALPTH
ncbi:MAG: HAMP domain-containing sensor histidine kinase [Myxococcota bacterium]